MFRISCYSSIHLLHWAPVCEASAFSLVAQQGSNVSWAEDDSKALTRKKSPVSPLPSPHTLACTVGSFIHFSPFFTLILTPYF